MKKLLALLLCLMMTVMLLASCGDAEDPSSEELVEQAFAKTADLDAYELDMAITMTMSMNIMGQTINQSMPMTIKLAAKDLKTETPKILMDLSMTVENETMTASAYIEGDWIYMTSDGESYKMPSASMDDMGALTDYSKQFEDLLVDLPEVVFEGISATKNDDGTKTVALSLTAEQFESIYASFASSLGESMGVIGDGVSITFKPATLSVTVKDDCVSKYDMDFAFDVSMDMDGDLATTEDAMSVSMTAGYDVTVVKTSGVTVTPPEGYQDFEEAPLF